MGQVSVGNAITSLRFCAALDWTLFFEQVSLVEQVLQRDPAAVYGSMDFQSRDRYRQAVEELAEPSGEAQLRVALRSVESAREVAERKTAEDRAAHVGYHLIGRGRRDLETDVSYQPTAGERVYLIPATEYAVARFDRMFGGDRRAYSGVAVGEAPEAYNRYRRETKVDMKGKFAFENVAPGRYIVATRVFWTEPKSYFTIAQGGAIYDIVDVEKDETARAIVSGR